MACLRGWLYDAVHGLALSNDAADAEAGRILQAYYFGRSSTHQQVALGLHLSRATYFRRLRHGLSTLRAQLLAPGCTTTALDHDDLVRS